MPAMHWLIHLVLLLGVTAPAAAERPAHLKSCRLAGVEHEALCGIARRPLDPSQPAGPAIDVHYAVLPALARNRQPDPVFFFAGGPGQGAMDLAGNVSRLLARVANRRDIVLVDQRGTGRSAPLSCEEPEPTGALTDRIDIHRAIQRLQACRLRLEKLPHGRLQHYITSVAMQDVDAVRQALGAPRINLVGGSYGTRAALEYMRQFPQQVRRAVLDGVAPADMVLPASFSPDNQAALDAVIDACATDKTCAARLPALRQSWQALLASLPRTVRATHPVTGQVQSLELTRDSVLGMARSPLYVPALAAALPFALNEAAEGRFEPLLGLSAALTSGRPMSMAEGMHFSVVVPKTCPCWRKAPISRVPISARWPPSCTAGCAWAGPRAQCRRISTLCHPHRLRRWCSRAARTPSPLPATANG
jgi:pimeloyl-ACP methyl ester carboxylesterase